MTHVLRIAHLRIALHVANPEVGNREGIHNNVSFPFPKCGNGISIPVPKNWEWNFPVPVPKSWE